MKKQIILGFLVAIIILIINHQSVAFGQTATSIPSPLTSPHVGGVSNPSVPGAPATGFGR